MLSLKGTKCPVCHSDLSDYTVAIRGLWQTVFITVEEAREIAELEKKEWAKKGKGKEAKGKEGWIYIVGNEDYALYKVGLTQRRPDERINEFSPALPFETRTFATFPASDCFEAESRIHNDYRLRRQNGEWFKLTREDISFIEENYGN